MCHKNSTQQNTEKSLICTLSREINRCGLSFVSAKTLQFDKKTNKSSKSFRNGTWNRMKKSIFKRLLQSNTKLRPESKFGFLCESQRGSSGKASRNISEAIKSLYRTHYKKTSAKSQPFNNATVKWIVWQTIRLKLFLDCFIMQNFILFKLREWNKN